MEQKMKRIATLGLALGFAFALAESAVAQVKFGVGGPITGPNAATGAQMKNGVEQAAADINAAGGNILEHCKGKRIAFVHDKRNYCKGLDDETLNTIKAGGMKEVLYEGIN